MKFAMLHRAFDAIFVRTRPAVSMFAEEAAASLTPLSCPEIIRLINQYELTKHRASPLTDA